MIDFVLLLGTVDDAAQTAGNCETFLIIKLSMKYNTKYIQVVRKKLECFRRQKRK